MLRADEDRVIGVEVVARQGDRGVVVARQGDRGVGGVVACGLWWRVALSGSWCVRDGRRLSSRRLRAVSADVVYRAEARAARPDDRRHCALRLPAV
ncbi:hypothetical protein ACW9HJ_21900 [Nocardia gipuzkoensis]